MELTVGSEADLTGSITSLVSNSHRLHLQRLDERSASIGLPLQRQSPSDPCHCSLERNCLRCELRCCYQSRLSNMFRSRLLCQAVSLFSSGVLPPLSGDEQTFRGSGRP